MISENIFDMPHNAQECLDFLLQQSITFSVWIPFARPGITNGRKAIMLMLYVPGPTLDFFLHVVLKRTLQDKKVYFLFSNEESEVRRATAVKQWNWNWNLLYLVLNP